MAIASIDKVRFRKFVYPGDVLQLTAVLLYQRENAWKFRAQADVLENFDAGRFDTGHDADSAVRVQCELMLMSVSPENSLP